MEKLKGLRVAMCGNGIAIVLMGFALCIDTEWWAYALHLLLLLVNVRFFRNTYRLYRKQQRHVLVDQLLADVFKSEEDEKTTGKQS